MTAAIIIFGFEFIVTLAPLGVEVWTLAAFCVGLSALGGAMMTGRVQLHAGIGAPDPRKSAIAGAIVIAIALVAATAILPGLGVWLIAAAGFTAVAIWLSGSRLVDAHSPAMRLGLFAAAVVLLVHSQIEMSLNNLSAAPLLAAVLGLAASAPLPSGGRERRGEGEAEQTEDVAAKGYSKPSGGQTLTPALSLRGRGGRIAAAAAVAAVAGTVLVFTWQIVMWQSALWFAATVVKSQGPDNKIAWFLFAVPDDYGDSTTAIESSRLHWEVSQNLPTALSPADRAKLREEYQGLAFKVLEYARARGNHLASLWRAEAQLARHAAQTTGNPMWLARALVAAEELLEHDPYGISAHMLAGDIAWEAGRRDLATRWYGRARELSELAYLDPLKQLTDEQRQRIETRLSDG